MIKMNIDKMNSYDRAEYYNSVLKSTIFRYIEEFEYLENKYAYAQLKDGVNVFVDRNGRYHTIEDLLEAVEITKTLPANDESDSLEEETDYLYQKINKLNDKINDLNDEIYFLKK